MRRTMPPRLTSAAAQTSRSISWNSSEALPRKPLLPHADREERRGVLPVRLLAHQVENLQEGGRLYLYRQQLEAGISVLRPLTPAHMTIYNAMQSVYSDVIGGADPYTALHNASQEIDEVIIDNGWNN